MKKSAGKLMLICAGVIAFATALAHLSCIYLGPECYSAQMAPPDIVESAKAGTLIAPLGTLLVSTIFFVMGGYALSEATVIRRFPKRKLIVTTIGVACTIRGILPIQLWYRYPEKVTDLVLIVGIIWLIVGVFYLLGSRWVRRGNALLN